MKTPLKDFQRTLVKREQVKLYLRVWTILRNLRVRSKSDSCANGTGSGDIGSTEHSDSEESSGSAHGRGKRPPKKRKSYSSAAEMLSFMQDNSAKQEKVEEEKVKLMREMQEEKKNFFSQFLEIIKNK